MSEEDLEEKEKIKKEEKQRILNELKKCVGHASFISKIKELENE
jgi:hypothetical protein